MDQNAIDEPIPATIEAAVLGLRDLREGPSRLAGVVALGPPAIPFLEALLRGPPESVDQPRSIAADAIRIIGGPDATAALRRALADCRQRTLHPVLEHVEDVVIHSIAQSLGLLGGTGAVDELIAALEQRARPGCVTALGTLRDPRAIPVLVDRLHVDVTRELCADALRAFDPEVVRPHLAGALAPPEPPAARERNDHIWGRAAAATLLGEMGGGEAALARALDDPERSVREAAALAATPGFNADRRVVQVLLDALDDADWIRCDEAMLALEARGAGVVDALLAAWARPGAGVRQRRRVVEVLDRIGGARATAALGELAADPDLALRRLATSALTRAGPSALPLLARMIADRDALVRHRARAAFRSAGSDAIPVLRGVRSRPLRGAWRLRWAARRLLRELSAR